MTAFTFETMLYFSDNLHESEEKCKSCDIFYSMRNPLNPLNRFSVIATIGVLSIP